MEKLTQEHIDPIHSDHICGLRVEENEIMADASYNYGKSNKFVPYRIHSCAAPINPGDRCEFLIEGEWVICEFFGEKWHAETRRIGYGSTKNRSLCNPEHSVRISSLGGSAAVRAGFHFSANGCHTTEMQRARIKGKLWWYNESTNQTRRSTQCPGPQWKRGRKAASSPSA